MADWKSGWPWFSKSPSREHPGCRFGSSGLSENLVEPKQVAGAPVGPVPPAFAPASSNAMHQHQPTANPVARVLALNLLSGSMPPSGRPVQSFAYPVPKVRLKILTGSLGGKLALWQVARSRFINSSFWVTKVTNSPKTTARFEMRSKVSKSRKWCDPNFRFWDQLKSENRDEIFSRPPPGPGRIGKNSVQNYTWNISKLFPNNCYGVTSSCKHAFHTKITWEFVAV